MNNQEMKTILKLIGLKQEESLLKWLFRPFWTALTVTTVFLALLIIGSGAVFVGIFLAPVVIFGVYMMRKIRNRLKEIKEDNLNAAYLK